MPLHTLSVTHAAAGAAAAFITILQLPPSLLTGTLHAVNEGRRQRAGLKFRGVSKMSQGRVPPEHNYSSLINLAELAFFGRDVEV